MPERLPGVSTDGRSCVWQRLCGADWGDTDAAVAGDASCAVAAVCVFAVRGVLRGLSGEDQYPGGADPSAEQSGEAERHDECRGSGDADDGNHLQEREKVSCSAADGADGRGSAGPKGRARTGLDWLAAWVAGWMDAG